MKINIILTLLFACTALLNIFAVLYVSSLLKQDFGYTSYPPLGGTVENTLPQMLADMAQRNSRIIYIVVTQTIANLLLFFLAYKAGVNKRKFNNCCQ